MLPTAKWLQKNGPKGLVKAMRENPEEFAHVPQIPDKKSSKRDRQSKPKPKR